MESSPYVDSWSPRQKFVSAMVHGYVIRTWDPVGITDLPLYPVQAYRRRKKTNSTSTFNLGRTTRRNKLRGIGA